MICSDCAASLDIMQKKKTFKLFQHYFFLCLLINLLTTNSISECWANNGTVRVWSPSLFPPRVKTRRETTQEINHEEAARLLNPG